MTMTVVTAIECVKKNFFYNLFVDRTPDVVSLHRDSKTQKFAP